MVGTDGKYTSIQIRAKEKQCHDDGKAYALGCIVRTFALYERP